MASVRLRNGRYYYRATVKGFDNKYHYIEHGGFNTYDEAYEAGNFAYPRKRYPKHFTCTRHLADLVFERFPEKHPAHLPLKLIYLYELSPREVYSLKISDVDFSSKTLRVGSKVIALTQGSLNLLSRHIDRVLNIRINLLLEPNEYLNVYLTNGKPIKVHQMDYVTKVLRSELNPGWNWREFHLYHLDRSEARTL